MGWNVWLYCQSDSGQSLQVAAGSSGRERETHRSARVAQLTVRESVCESYEVLVDTFIVWSLGRQLARAFVLLIPSGSDALVMENCKGCDIVQSDHAPQAGVAQGIFDGELVRRRVGHQVGLEEEQDKEVERRVRRDAQRTTHRCACMDDME